MRKGWLSDRRALAIVKMSVSALRFRSAADCNVEVRRPIVALARRHPGYGIAMINLKPRQAGELWNRKCVSGLYGQEKL